MLWVWVFVGIGVAGLAMTVGYAVWLWHKASDLFSELEQLGVRAGELADLLASIDLAPVADGGMAADGGWRSTGYTDA